MLSKSVTAVMILAAIGIFTSNAQESSGNYLNAVNGIPIRNVGPAGGPGNGRVSDLAVYDADPKIFYIASASGGVFRTTTAGRICYPVFEREGASSIGAIAVSQKNPNLVWVGTGEGWHRNDVGWGDGIYKSIDGGKNWNNTGLPKSNSFGHIAIDPKNEDIVFAAVLGSAWAYGPDRGIYRTKDGGKTWKRILYISEETGAADVQIDPKNPKIILAAMYQHRRLPYGFIYGGTSGGIFRSTDGGESWKKIESGLPKNVGRISISFFPKNPSYVAAAVEAAAPSSGFYTSDNGGKTWTEQTAFHYETDGRSNNSPGHKWYRPYYNQLIKYDPVDVNKIYYGGPFHYTKDRGKNFYGWAGDDHALWIDPSNPNHMIHGSDGGVYQIWEEPKYDGFQPVPFYTDRPANLPGIGQFYHISYDMREPYWLMGNLQDESAWLFPSQSVNGAVSRIDMLRIGGGESGSTKADPNDPSTIYTNLWGANLKRVDLKTGKSTLIFRDNEINYSNPETNNAYWNLTKRERAGWNCPFILSPWNSATVYFGTNFMYKSIDRGNHWQQISPDLTHDQRKLQKPENAYWKSAENHVVKIWQTISSISESSKKQGLLWVGTDDGYVQISHDDGGHWENITANIPGLPPYTWVSSIIASSHKEGRAYATFDGHRNGDLKTYVYVTEDYGKTWDKISESLNSNESSYVIKEGLINENLLFLGTEFSLYVSLDKGKHWERFCSGGFPTVAVYDLEIHPRELDLIIGTHGRSAWILPVGTLEQIKNEVNYRETVLYSPNTMYLFNTQQVSKNLDEIAPERSENTQPGSLFSYYLPVEAREVTITISDPSGKKHLVSLDGSRSLGFNYLQWKNGSGGLITEAGDYRVTLNVDGKEYHQTLKVKQGSYEFFRNK